MREATNISLLRSWNRRGICGLQTCRSYGARNVLIYGSTNISLLTELEPLVCGATGYKHAAPDGAWIVFGARGYKRVAPKGARNVLGICGLQTFRSYGARTSLI